MNRNIRIGYWDRTCKTALYYPHDSHLILTAPAGAGKGRDILVPSLLEYDGSVVVIDPKGQLAAVCGPYLARKKHRVFALNPFRILPKNLAPLAAAGFNPLTVLDPTSLSFGADCDSLAEAIVYTEGVGDNAAYFSDSARQLVSGLIMVLAAYAPPDKKNLVNLYEIISGTTRFYSFVRRALKIGGALGILISGRLGRFNVARAEENNKELTGIINSARTQIGFMGNEAIASSLLAPGPVLRFSDLRQKPAVVFLILPTRYLATSAKWFRLVIAAAMADLLREEGGPVPVLAMLDEFAQLGTLKVMSDIMGIGRGYKLQLWPVLQDLNQLEELYPKRWQTFLSNAGAQLFFAPRDLKTAEYVSKKCGDRQVNTKTRSVSESAWGPRESVDNIGVSTGYGADAVPYLKPHQVAEIGGDEMLVFGENIAGVIRAGRKPYWKMAECRGKYSPDPYHS